MATLLDLSDRMRATAKAIPINVNALKQKVISTILNDLVYVTPVDTSNALSKWKVSIGPVTDSTFSPYYLGAHGSTRDQSAQEAIADAQPIIDGLVPGQAAYIGNAAPYIRRLNDDGYSPQEPAGFVERATLLGRKTLQGVSVTGIK
jgi:hypothetical protein